MLPVLKREDDLGAAEAFGRDGILRERVRSLIVTHGVRTIVETGAWRGYTTLALSEMAGEVFSVEIDRETFGMAQETTADAKNVSLYCADSAIWLPRVIDFVAAPVLFYLDAHWLDKWPLFDELEAIIKDGRPCVIAIHDCQVPGHPELGFDTYSDQPLALELVRPYLDRLKFPWRHSFNRESEGHRRGVLFVEPIQ